MTDKSTIRETIHRTSPSSRKQKFYPFSFSTIVGMGIETNKFSGQITEKLKENGNETD